MQNHLPHDQFWESIRTDGTRVVMRRVPFDGLNDPRVNGVFLPCDDQHAVLDHVGPHIEGRFSMDIWSPSHCGERVIRCYFAGMFPAHKMPGLVGNVNSQFTAVCGRGQG